MDRASGIGGRGSGLNPGSSTSEPPLPSGSPLRVVVCGACGRMGAAVAELIAGQTDMELAGGVEAFGHANVGRPLGRGMVMADIKEAIGSADVIVDFSSPQSSMDNLGQVRAHSASRNPLPYILGTTGFDGAQQEEIKTLSHSVPIVMAPNFSVGVNVLYRLTENAARLLGEDYDIEIIEFHHRRKKDAPSGTARQLSHIAMRATGRGQLVHGREGQTGEKPKNEIGVHAVRSGDVVGEHYVVFGTEGERVELVHKASSRLAFAQGVLRAIRFVVGKPAGLYSMADVLGL